MAVSLGATRPEVYRNWEQASPVWPKQRVIGFVPLLGRFDWYLGKIWRLHEAGKTPAWREVADKDDLYEIDLAIRRGWLQVQSECLTGVIHGQGGQGLDQSYPVVVLHQATGRPFCEGALETEFANLT